MNPQKNKRVYDYVEGRNTVPMYDRYNFDVDKLVNVGAVFITPPIDGDSDSPTYKEWLDEGGSHLITLYNVKHSSPNGWIRKAITKKSDTSGFRHNFIGKLYDGKYNQILWSLEKLGIDPNDMVIENNSLQESIKRILREELSVDIIYPDFDGVFNNMEVESLTHKDGTLYVRWKDKDGNNVFSRNNWGRLFIHQCEPYRELRFYSRMISQTMEEFEETLIKYLNDKYENEFMSKPIKQISESDTYHCFGD